MFHSQVSGIAEGATVALTRDAQGLRLSVVTRPTREDIRQSRRAGHGLAGDRGPMLDLLSPGRSIAARERVASGRAPTSP